MKTKIVKEEYNEITGITKVVIQNKYGHFTGVAKCHPKDKNNYSMFQGSRIAASKANINFLKFRIQQTKAAIKALNTLLSDFYSNFDLNPDSYVGPVYTHAQLMIDKYKDDIRYFEDSIDIIKKSITIMDEERQKILERSKKNK